MNKVFSEKGLETIFMAMLKECGTDRQDDIWHRGLVILDEVSLEIKQLPTATQVQGYRKIASMTAKNEIRCLAEKLATQLEED